MEPMEPVKTINLIQTKTILSPQLETVTALLRKLSIWALTILIASGVVVSGVFYYLRLREEQLANTKQQLSQAIAQYMTREGLLFALKQRMGLTGKILGVQQPVGKVFDTLAGFVSPGQMTAVSLDDHNQVSLMIHAQSITDVVSITDGLMKQATVNRVRAPQLVSLTLGKEGGVDVGLLFIAVF
jgi:hypothetical protein